MQKSASLRKGRGDIRHNRRDIIAGSCYEDRIQDNVVLADYDIKDVYHILFDEVVEDYNSTQKRSDRKIKDYYSKINNDKKTNPFHEVIVQVGSMDDRLDRDEYISIYSKWLDRFEKENDKMKVFGAFMHFDEKGAPHMHVDYIPIATYNKGMALRVSNDKAIKQMGYKSWLEWKDKQVENLKEIMLEHGIEKKSMGNEERYLNPNQFKQLQRFKEQAELEIRETVQQELDQSQSPLEVKNVPFLGEVVKKSDVDEREKQLQNEISSHHMILVDQFMKLKVSEEFWQMFLVVIQLGAVLAVVVLDFKKLWPFHKNDPSRESNWNYISTNERIGKLQKFADKYINMNKIVLWLKILVSCVPAIIVALPFNNWIEKTFMNYWVVSVMLIVYGVLFIVIENYNKSRKPSRTKLSDISFKDALFIGIFQLLALIPGTSRSGATIIGGILLGMSRKLAAEYTFFLAIPVMFGASFLKLIKFGLHFTGTEVVYLLLGMVVAFGVSIAAIKFLMGYIKKHDFKVFGWYRIALGVVVLAYFLLA